MLEFWKKLWMRISYIANLHSDTDMEATVNLIKKAIEFKGNNVWILIFAIVIASVGLNMNSTAVIIGAMLISPLMGPINGIGLAVGTIDMDLLRLSLKNLLVMVIISLLSSTLYFIITPISDAQSELLARTTPTIFDVLIAFFGGAAGITALSRREQSATIISGVAIATALMPPLCTAGFGIATMHFPYFFGALYLFFINSFFIALSTFLMVRYLGFPVRTYLDPDRERLVRRTIIFFSLVVIVPSVFIAFDMIRETAFNSAAIKYVNKIQEHELFADVEMINNRREYGRNEKSIFLSFVGKPLTDAHIEYLHHQKNKLGLQDVRLDIKQIGGGIIDEGVQTKFLASILEQKDKQIRNIEREITQRDTLIQSMKVELSKLKGSGEQYMQIAKEISVQYPEIESFSVINAIYTDVLELKQDTVPTLFVNWKQVPDSIRNEQFSKWLQIRLNLPLLDIKSDVVTD